MSQTDVRIVTRYVSEHLPKTSGYLTEDDIQNFFNFCDADLYMMLENNSFPSELTSEGYRVDCDEFLEWAIENLEIEDGRIAGFYLEVDDEESDDEGGLE